MLQEVHGDSLQSICGLWQRSHTQDLLTHYIVIHERVTLEFIPLTASDHEPIKLKQPSGSVSNRLLIDFPLNHRAHSK